MPQGFQWIRQESGIKETYKSLNEVLGLRMIMYETDIRFSADFWAGIGRKCLPQIALRGKAHAAAVRKGSTELEQFAQLGFRFENVSHRANERC